LNQHTKSPGQLARTRAAATALAATAAAYTAVGLWYFYVDFFRFLGQGRPGAMSEAGYGVLVDCHTVTLLGPWRPLLFVTAIGLLAWSAKRLWQNKEGGRALSLLTLWGVLLPQSFWFTEFSVDWFGGRGMYTALLAFVAVAAVPSMLLFEGRHTLVDWRRLSHGRGRLLGTAIVMSWLGFVATQYLDNSLRYESDAAYLAAVATIFISGLAVVGIFRLRVWGLALAVAGAVTAAVLPLSFLSIKYVGGHGYIDSFIRDTTGSTLNAVGTALLPITALLMVSGPFLRVLARRLRG
jgi:hypothetical protein